MNIFKKIFCSEKKGETYQLCDLTILRPESYPCDKCNIANSDYCRKLHFHDRTICVVHKDNESKVSLKTNKKGSLPIKH